MYAVFADAATVALAAADAEPGTNYGNIVALLSGLTALVSIAITSLRKRKDVSVEEMQLRIDDLEKKAVEREQDLAMAETQALAHGRSLFVVRSLLAERGIPDPTVRESTPDA